MEQIARSEDHVWNSKETAKGDAWYRNDKSPSSVEEPAPMKLRSASKPIFKPSLGKTPKERLPNFISPQLAEQSTTPPTASGWLHEIKLDGYRIQARKDGAQVQLLTRTGLDWTHRMKSIATQVALLPAQSAIFDGEVAVLDEDGRTNFADLQAAFQERGRKPLTYFIFDLLHLNGHNLRDLPLIERKALLEELFKGMNDKGTDDSIRFCEHVEGNGDSIFRKA